MKAAGDNNMIEFDYSEAFEKSMNGGKGATKKQVEAYKGLRDRGCEKVTVHIYNIKDGSPGDKPGFNALKKHLEDVRLKDDPDNELAPVRLLVGGGDGTVMWAVSELDKHGIDESRV